MSSLKDRDLHCDLFVFASGVADSDDISNLQKKHKK